MIGVEDAGFRDMKPSTWSTAPASSRTLRRPKVVGDQKRA